MKSFFVACILLSSSLLAWNLSSESLTRKIDSVLPSWMKEGIEEDFRFFKKGISFSHISLCLQKLKELPGIEKCGLVEIYANEGAIKSEPLFSLTQEQRKKLDVFIFAIDQLQSIKPLSNLHFILSLEPSFNRPFLLKETSIPIFAVSKEKHNSKVILIPRLWNEDRPFCSFLHPWHLKLEKAIWRGSATDGPYDFLDWDFRPRSRLTLKSRYDLDHIDAGFIPCATLTSYMTQWLKNLHIMSSYVPPEQQMTYKYLVSLDGANSPSSFEWQLFSQSLIFKASSNKIEWFYRGLLPDHHFLVFRADTTDLIDKILWAKTHDDEAKIIADRGYQFASTHLADEEMFVYLYHVLQKYKTKIVEFY